MRNAGAFGEFPDGGQTLAGWQFTECDAELDQSAKLNAQRHRKRSIKRAGKI
jgi:hypothetical protein